MSFLFALNFVVGSSWCSWLLGFYNIGDWFGVEFMYERSELPRLPLKLATWGF